MLVTVSVREIDGIDSSIFGKKSVWKLHSSLFTNILQCSSALVVIRMFIRHRRSENSLAKFHSFPERVLLFHNKSPVTTIIILNEIPELYIVTHAGL